MASLKLKNTEQTELTITHEDGVGALTVTSKELSKLKTVDTISGLRSLTEAPETLWVSGYHTKDDGAFGSNIFRWNATSVDDDNGGTIIKLDSITTGRYELQFDGSVNVKWFGAVGDGVTDDTEAINKTLVVGGGIKFHKATYKITDTISFTGNTSIFIDGGGATLACNGSEMGTVLHISPSTDIDFCSVKNLKIEGNSIAKIGIFVETDTSRIADVRLDDNSIQDLDNVATASSTTGIRVYAGNISTLDIKSNSIFNVTRTQVNPGIIASVGIGVYSLAVAANITGNAINGVSSPSGDGDADGIQVFSDNRLLDERQTAMPVISNNRVQQCKGRFIKLQTSNGKVYSNYMSNIGIEVIDDFRGIDAQTGGVSIFDNTIRIGSYTGGASLGLFSLQMKDTGDFENVYIVRANQITIEATIPYGFLLFPTTNSNAKVLISENIFQDKSNSYFISNIVYAGVAEGMDDYTIKVNDNIVQIDSGYLFRFNTTTLGLLTSAVTGPSISANLNIHLTDNINTLETTSSDLVYNETSGGSYPYLQHLTISGNSRFYRNNITCQGMDIRKLPEGTAFYYNTDGTALGGLINAPSGYDRYVTIEAFSKAWVRLTYAAGNKFCVAAKDGSSNTEYTGTSI